MGDEKVVYISGQEAARRLGCAQTTVSRVARTNRIGVFVEDGRLAALATDDLPTLKSIIKPTSGNPVWIAAAKTKRRRRKA